MSEEDFLMLRHHGIYDGALVTAMKMITDSRFFAFKFSSQENTITAIFAGGKTDRLVVVVPQSQKFLPMTLITSTNTQTTWTSLDEVRQYYLDEYKKRFEIKIQETSKEYV